MYLIFVLFFIWFCTFVVRTYVILPIHYVQNVARLIALHILHVCIFTNKFCQNHHGFNCMLLTNVEHIRNYNAEIPFYIDIYLVSTYLGPCSDRQMFFNCVRVSPQGQ